MYQCVCIYDWIVELSQTRQKHSVMNDVITSRGLSDFVMVERWLKSVSDIALIKKNYTYRISCCLCASSSSWSASFCCLQFGRCGPYCDLYHIWGPSHFLLNNMSTAHHCHHLPTWILAAIVTYILEFTVALENWVTTIASWSWQKNIIMEDMWCNRSSCIYQWHLYLVIIQSSHSHPVASKSQLSSPVFLPAHLEWHIRGWKPLD